MIQNLHIFKSPEELASQFALQLMGWIDNHTGEAFHLAISGGKTPELLFTILAEQYADSMQWQKVHFWWVDERMVSPEDAESNFGTAHRLLLSKIIIPEENIHPIKGENNSEAEALSYSEQIQVKLTLQNDWPVFDLILLGIGDDGHTASIFPDQINLIDSNRICEVAVHNQSGQKRITLTGKVINNSLKVCFLITGISKADRLTEILANKAKANLLPAAHIHPKDGLLAWYVDKAAAKMRDTPMKRS